MQLPATVSPLEILWTLVTGSGVFLAAWNCWDAVRDMEAVQHTGEDGPLLITAAGERNDQAMILLALVCWMTIGILAMFALPGREPDGDPSLSSILAPWLAIASALGLIFLSYSKKRRRRRVLSLLRAAVDPQPSVPHDGPTT